MCALGPQEDRGYEPVFASLRNQPRCCTQFGLTPDFLDT